MSKPGGPEGESEAICQTGAKTVTHPAMNPAFGLSQCRPAVAALLMQVTIAVAGFEGGHSTPAQVPDVAELFGYDRGSDLALKTVATVPRGEVTVTEVEFVAGDEAAGEPRRVPATLVRPAGAGPFAAVLWVHWLGDPATTNRTQFLEEAVALAREGVVSLLVEAMWARPHWYKERTFATDRGASVRQVVELRRALDVLLAQPGVEAARVALVGHDYGAMHAALMAGVESRVRAYVLIAGTPSLLDWAFFAAKPEAMADYLAQMQPLELGDSLARNPRSEFLLQYAEKDEYVPLAKAVEFFAAVAGPKRLIVYGGASHAMTEVPAIRADRTAWLRQELQLAPAAQR